MKNPRSQETGAFLMQAFTSTVASPVNVTSAPLNAMKNEIRFRWDPRSNSVERLIIEKGTAR